MQDWGLGLMQFNPSCLSAARSVEFHLRMVQNVKRAAQQLPLSMFLVFVNEIQLLWHPQQESRRKAKLQGVDATCSFEHRDAIGIASKSGKGWAVWLRISPQKFPVWPSSYLKQLPEARTTSMHRKADARDHKWSSKNWVGAKRCGHKK